MKKIRICAVVLIISLVFPLVAGAIDINSDGACVLDAQTGEIYFQKNANVPMTPASLTKIMTLFVIYEEMEKGTLTEETLIPISQNAARLSRNGEATNIPLTAGTNLKLGTLIDAIVIVSACASCTAVGEYLCGSESSFAERMNEVAAQYGIEAYFTDASGLSNYNLITPLSLAKLVKIFIEKYPGILEYTSKTSANINGKTYSSTNKLLYSWKKDYYYIGADGFKTGTTKKAGKCLVSTALRDDVRIVGVVMHADTDYLRYSDTRKILDDGFYRATFLGGNVFSTDTRVYINGNEIPCYRAMGRNNELCITAENLRYYGFDVNYEAESETLYIEQKEGLEVNPVYGEKLAPGLPLHKTYKQPKLKAIVIKDGVSYQMKSIISLNGQCAISIDELGELYYKAWDDATKTLDVRTK